MEWDAKCSDTFWNVSLQKQGLLLSLLVIKVYLYVSSYFSLFHLIMAFVDFLPNLLCCLPFT